ncbi:MAG: hypothetical protein HFH38_11075 [Lachnospiraceae bacterium]|jgi:hypothetical protein|nr:hypothetical protein [Lachnospiraceae bacterium]
MDLWENFGMGDRISELWRELGISAGTAIVILVALYFVVKWAVRNGILEASKKIEEKRLQEGVKTEGATEGSIGNQSGRKSEE